MQNLITFNNNKKQLLLLWGLIAIAGVGCQRNGDVANGEQQLVHKTDAFDNPTAWVGIDFADSLTLSDHAKFTTNILHYCQYLMSISDSDVISQNVDSLLTRSMRAGVKQYASLVKTVHDILGDPNSVMRNEELLIYFLRREIDEPKVDESLKERPRFLLEKALMNRPGTVATDFDYIGLDNRKGTLHSIDAPFVLLYFFNPECHDCRRTKQVIEQAPILSSMIKDNTLVILAVYPDEDLSAWYNFAAEQPQGWRVCRMASDKEREKYYLPAIPNIYLLDSEKRVILKDAPIEQVIKYLENTCNSVNNTINKHK